MLAEICRSHCVRFCKYFSQPFGEGRPRGQTEPLGIDIITVIVQNPGSRGFALPKGNNPPLQNRRSDLSGGFLNIDVMRSILKKT